MADAVPLILVVVLAIGLVVGVVLYWQLLNTPMDEWDEVTHDGTDTSEQSDNEP